MTKPNRRDVSRKPEGKGWNVTKPDANQPVSQHRTQAAADQAAARDLRRTGGGERVTHGRDGKIRSKDTIPPGRDPNPPKDTEHLDALTARRGPTYDPGWERPDETGSARRDLVARTGLPGVATGRCRD